MEKNEEKTALSNSDKKGWKETTIDQSRQKRQMAEKKRGGVEQTYGFLYLYWSYARVSKTALSLPLFHSVCVCVCA